MIALSSTLIPTRRHRRRGDARGVLGAMSRCAAMMLVMLIAGVVALGWLP